MQTLPHWASIGLLALTLAGCAAAPVAAPVSTAPTTRPMNPRGLSAILNRSDDQLVAMFGPPRLDVIEGAARKLQFTGESCVLDIYLYPPENGGERKSTYADARNLQGAAVDRAGCVRALRK
ncbi:hypothetical protein [Alterisphingorhabdus coralli]|uniref:Uncharacterized protein n=1 Tax=Alterisphingorhabdus coralli TaxID=3071408 RepID=A0AA97I219_9SPHN|nr:hypothetical protein [Parasphingorhabdus sp. SCSIO 66989]WOE75320.1 hypothetical protein RB602_00985 [Parasphingorhabdus sp. SCSIO 66989]